MHETRMIQGRRGFDLLPTVRLIDTMKRYQRLRDEARDTATADYARVCIREIRDELRRRDHALAVAA
jgi:hypothetical protein